jgi:F-type H+-transporting ATPase subunit epsilon
MSTLRLEIVTVEGVVFSDDVSIVVAPGSEGQLGLLPHHAPLISELVPGELMVRKDGEEIYLAVSGGFIEVLSDKVTVLADSAERAEDIDIARAQEARKRAEERLKSLGQGVDPARAEAALRRSIARLKVAETARYKKNATRDRLQ